jgi:hypothetical protein
MTMLRSPFLFTAVSVSLTLATFAVYWTAYPKYLRSSVEWLALSASVSIFFLGVGLGGSIVAVREHNRPFPGMLAVALTRCVAFGVCMELLMLMTLGA